MFSKAKKFLSLVLSTSILFSTLVTSSPMTILGAEESGKVSVIVKDGTEMVAKDFTDPIPEGAMTIELKKSVIPKLSDEDFNISDGEPIADLDNLKKGDQFYVDFVVNRETDSTPLDLKSFGFGVTYDKNVIELVKEDEVEGSLNDDLFNRVEITKSSGDEFVQIKQIIDSMTQAVTDSKGNWHLSGLLSDGCNTNGTLFSLRFKVVGGGDSDITLGPDTGAFLGVVDPVTTDVLNLENVYIKQTNVSIEESLEPTNGMYIKDPDDVRGTGVKLVPAETVDPDAISLTVLPYKNETDEKTRSLTVNKGDTFWVEFDLNNLSDDETRSFNGYEYRIEYNPKVVKIVNDDRVTADELTKGITVSYAGRRNTPYMTGPELLARLKGTTGSGIQTSEDGKLEYIEVIGTVNELTSYATISGSLLTLKFEAIDKGQSLITFRERPSTQGLFVNGSNPMVPVYVNNAAVKVTDKPAIKLATFPITSGDVTINFDESATGDVNVVSSANENATVTGEGLNWAVEIANGSTVTVADIIAAASAIVAAETAGLVEITADGDTITIKTETTEASESKDPYVITVTKAKPAAQKATFPIESEDVTITFDENNLENLVTATPGKATVSGSGSNWKVEIADKDVTRVSVSKIVKAANEIKDVAGLVSIVAVKNDDGTGTITIRTETTEAEGAAPYVITVAKAKQQTVAPEINNFQDIIDSRLASSDLELVDLEEEAGAALPRIYTTNKYKKADGTVPTPDETLAANEWNAYYRKDDTDGSKAVYVYDGSTAKSAEAYFDFKDIPLGETGTAKLEMDVKFETRGTSWAPISILDSSGANVVRFSTTGSSDAERKDKWNIRIGSDYTAATLVVMEEHKWIHLTAEFNLADKTITSFKVDGTELVPAPVALESEAVDLAAIKLITSGSQTTRHIWAKNVVVEKEGSGSSTVEDISFSASNGDVTVNFDSADLDEEVTANNATVATDKKNNWTVSIASTSTAVAADLAKDIEAKAKAAGATNVSISGNTVTFTVGDTTYSIEVVKDGEEPPAEAVKFEAKDGNVTVSFDSSKTGAEFTVSGASATNSGDNWTVTIANSTNGDAAALATDIEAKAKAANAKDVVKDGNKVTFTVGDKTYSIEVIKEAAPAVTDVEFSASNGDVTVNFNSRNAGSEVTATNASVTNSGNNNWLVTIGRDTNGDAAALAADIETKVRATSATDVSKSGNRVTFKVGNTTYSIEVIKESGEEPPTPSELNSIRFETTAGTGSDNLNIKFNETASGGSIEITGGAVKSFSSIGNNDNNKLLTLNRNSNISIEDVYTAFVNGAANAITDPEGIQNSVAVTRDGNTIILTTDKGVYRVTVTYDSSSSEEPTTSGSSSSGSGTPHGSSSSGGGSSSSSKPSTNKPSDSETPGTTTPGTDKPGTTTPGTNKPGTSTSSGKPVSTTLNGIKVKVPVSDTANRKNFVDVAPNTPWAEAAINKLAMAGIINGQTSTTFNPKANTTRGDFMVVMAKMLGLEGTPSSNFADVPPGKYYANAIGLTKELGIASGIGNNMFAPDRTISRQECMAIVARVLNMLGIQGSTDTSVLSKFNDSANIAGYARENVALLVNMGIVNGSTDGGIHPTDNITRAEMAVIMSKVYDLILAEAEKSVAAEEAAAAKAEAEEKADSESEKGSESESKDEKNSEESTESTTESSTTKK